MGVGGRGRGISDHQPQIFFSLLGFLDVVRVAAFHKVLTMFHILYYRHRGDAYQRGIQFAALNIFHL